MIKNVLTSLALVAMMTVPALAASTAGDLYGSSSGGKTLKILNHRQIGHDGDIIHVYVRGVDTGVLSDDLLVGHISNDDFRTINFYEDGCRFNAEVDFRDGHVQKLTNYNFCNGSVTWNTYD